MKKAGMLLLVTVFSILFAKEIVKADEPVSLGELKKEFVRPKEIQYLDNNKYSTEKEILGKNLFFDPRLSGSGMISCSTCHNPSLSWSDGLEKGVGHQHKQLARRSPTILNLAWTDKLMWDGRFSQLENQALGPMGSEAEMNMDMALLPNKIKGIAGYRELFAVAYPNQEITNELIGKAIAVFERGIVSGEAPFDKWIKGSEKAITEDAKKGFILFNTKANCAACHSGWRFTDDSFYDIGLKSTDIGRGKFLRMASQQNAFKTPGLRNVSARAPYMHDGSESDIMAIIDFYDRGGDTKREGHAASVKPLNLTKDEKLQLAAFLNTLTSKDKDTTLPLLPK